MEFDYWQENRRPRRLTLSRSQRASADARAGVPLPTVQKLAGHSDIKTTLKYYNQVNDADLRAAVDKLREAAG